MENKLIQSFTIYSKVSTSSIILMCTKQSIPLPFFGCQWIMAENPAINMQIFKKSWANGEEL